MLKYYSAHVILQKNTVGMCLFQEAIFSLTLFVFDSVVVGVRKLRLRFGVCETLYFKNFALFFSPRPG